jgi:hypothetical protein
VRGHQRKRNRLLAQFSLTTNGDETGGAVGRGDCDRLDAKIDPKLEREPKVFDCGQKHMKSSEVRYNDV